MNELNKEVDKRKNTQGVHHQTHALGWVEELDMKNHEKIRNMSIEELADVIMCPYDGDPIMKCPDGFTCTKCVYEWLQKEEVE